MLQDAAPQIGDALAREPRIGHDRRAPIGRAGFQDVERSAVFGGGGERALAVLAVRLVDGDHVGKLDHAFLQALQLVARTRNGEQQKKVRQVGNCRLGLADPHGLDQHHVEPRRFADQHGLAGLGGYATEASRRGGGPDESSGVGREPRHAGLVGEDRASGAAGGRIDREDRDAMPSLGQIGAERVDRGRLAHARHAGDPGAHRLAGIREQLLHEPARGLLMVRAFGFDQRDGARHDGALAGGDPAHERFEVGRF